jgi:GNAT superfamily N-acetyltransferase
MTMEQAQARERAGSLWAWWRDDLLPVFPRLAGLQVSAAEADGVVAALTDYTVVQVSRGRQSGYRPYVACLDGVCVAYGWSASQHGSFGPQETPFTIPERNRYLWGFVTLLAWRGRGIYPRLLQAIVSDERQEADRFWALHDASNRPSARGLVKAGFGLVGHVYFLAGGGFGLIPVGPAGHVQAGAVLLELPIVAPPAGFEPDPLGVMR